MITTLRQQQQSFKQRPRLNSFVEPSFNPFIHKLNFTKLQKLQIAFMSVTIAPIRLALAIFAFILTWLSSLIATVGIAVPFQEPASPFRFMLCGIVRKLGRLVFFFFGFHKIEFRGIRASAKDAPIGILVPHVGMFDTIAFFAADPLPSSIAPALILKLFFAAPISLAFHSVFVARDDPDSKRKTLLEVKRRIRGSEKWPQLYLFPEGTCTNAKALVRFKSGAFAPGCPVQPIMIEYLNDMNTFIWTEAEVPAIKVVWYSLCQWSNKVRITYLPVYYPDKEEKSNAKLFANNVRRMMADAFNLPITDHTFEDSRLMRRAASLNLPIESGAVEFAKINEKLGIDIHSVHKKLKEFSNIACKDKGVINLENFAKFLNLPVCDAVKDLFYLYDRNDSGSIDFREYPEELISKEEFHQVLHDVFKIEINGSEIYDQIDRADPEQFTYEELFKFAKKRPEYAKLLLLFQREDSLPNIHDF